MSNFLHDDDLNPVDFVGEHLPSTLQVVRICSEKSDCAKNDFSLKKQSLEIVLPTLSKKVLGARLENVILLNEYFVEIKRPKTRLENNLLL